MSHNYIKNAVEFFERGKREYEYKSKKRFLYYLFKDIGKLKGKNIDFGPAKAYSNLYFAPPNIEGFERSSNIVINVKDQDFSIFKEIILIGRKVKYIFL
ncbi:MAG: Bpu10I family restriction endonuclease [Methanosarcinales archaeon]